MMNTNTKTRKEAGHGFEAMTEFTLFANAGELEETQGKETIKLKIERIEENARRKGIEEDVAEMLSEINYCLTDFETNTAINTIGQIVYEYQKPTAKQVAFAEELATEFGKKAPKADLAHDFNFFSAFIKAGLEARKTLPPTTKQLSLLEGMSYCPDCPSQEGVTFNRGQASEFIGKYNEAYQAWKLTRASDETIKQLLTAYALAKDPQTYSFCLQFDENTAQKMIGQLKIERERLREKSVTEELNECFRQTFIDEDNEKRKKAALRK